MLAAYSRGDIMNFVIDHHIQKDILRRLMQAKTLRFSELKPEGLESNSFMYHLRQVMAAGYVLQGDDKSYALTPLGLTYIDGLSMENALPRKQPKLIAILVLKNTAGQYLLARRLMQPTIDTWMLPSGKQHFGESTLEHAKRETAELFGLNIDLIYRGMVEVRLMHGDILVTHLVSRLYSGDHDGAAPDATEKFEFEWHSMTDDLDLTPGTDEIITALEAAGDDQLNLSLDVQVE